MEEKKLNTKLIKSLMERKNDFEVGEKEKFAYKNEYGNVWSLVLRREEEQYSPFIFAIEGNKVGTNETWSRRYTSMEQALLHIVNDFNENANIENKYIPNDNIRTPNNTPAAIIKALVAFSIFSSFLALCIYFSK